MTKILSAKPIVDHFIGQLKQQCKDLKARGVTPSLKVVLVGNSPASLVYTQNKKKFCEKIGASCEIICFPENIELSTFTARLTILANDSNVHGIIVQLPLPKHLQDLDLDEFIPAQKDVDGFHSVNQGALLLGKKVGHISCTPKGILTLIQHYGIPLRGKNVVIVGRSNIVGKPIGLLLLGEDATVTFCHSQTLDLKHHTKHADLVVAAIGRAKFLDRSFFSSAKQTAVIDVGINRDTRGQLCGDVDFEQVKDIVGAITPVPGGVGPLTILSLAQNLLQATKNSLV